MASLTLTLHMDPAKVIERAGPAIEAWPEETRKAFAEDWKALEAEGAEIVEMVTYGSRVYACVSDDFQRLLRAYGVAI